MSHEHKDEKHGKSTQREPLKDDVLAKAAGGMSEPLEDDALSQVTGGVAQEMPSDEI